MVDVFAERVCIDQHAVSTLAAQQVVDGRVQRLALDVPERNVNGADCRHGHRTAPPVCTAIEILPDILGLEGIAANEAWKHVVR